MSKENKNLEETVDYKGSLKDIESELESSYIELKIGLEFHEKIGSGGLGEVWRAHLVGESDRTEIAVKVSKRTNLNNLRKESFIASQLKHDDIGKIILYEEIGNKGMIIMDYIKGRDLTKIVDRHNKLGLHIPQKFSAFIAWVCCEALKYAHRSRVYDENGREVIGVIHRDISPGNIIINDNGYPKLVDFGIGILSSDLEDPEIRDQIAGKIGFIAPEILEPEIIKGKNIDQRADIYSLGMVMDYLVRGKNPIIERITNNGSKLEAIAESKEIIKTKLKPLKEEVPGISEEYVRIVEKATEINRKKRYQSAFSMKEDLREYLFEKGYGPDRDRLRLYIDLIHTPGIVRYLEEINKEGNINIKIPKRFENQLEEAKELMPYMIRNGKFCLEIFENSYQTEELGYLAIY